jgi:hypothetical protein
MAGNLNIVSLLYICFRLAPFIIICVFAFSSLFNQDVKGIVFLMGLLGACFVAILSGEPLKYFIKPGDPPNDRANNTQICNIFALTDTGPLSTIPLSLVVFSFTLSYLSTLVTYYNVVMQNIPMFVTFPLLIIADVFWIRKNDCSSTLECVIAGIIGVLIGIGWGSLVIGTNDQNYSYFSGYGPRRDKCFVPSEQHFKCSVDN